MKIIVTTVCPFCGHVNEIEVEEKDYKEWKDGTMAQIAFPYLSVEERESLISGMCDVCQKRIFGEEE